MDGFEHGVSGADVGGSSSSNSALDLGGFVGEDVAVEVGHDEDLEIGASCCVEQFGGHDIDVPAVPLDAGVFLGDAFGDL